MKHTFSPWMPMPWAPSGPLEPDKPGSPLSEWTMSSFNSGQKQCMVTHCATCFTFCPGAPSSPGRPGRPPGPGAPGSPYDFSQIRFRFYFPNVLENICRLFMVMKTLVTRSDLNTFGPGSPMPLSPGAPCSPGKPWSPWKENVINTQCYRPYG